MIHETATARTLGFVRAWVFSIWLLVVLPEPLHELAVLPSGLYEPQGVMHLIPEALLPWLLEPGTLTALWAALVAGLVLSAVGVRPYRLVAGTTAVLLTLHQGLVRSLGFVNHSELAVLYAVYVLALFPAADGFSWPRRTPAGRPPARRAPDAALYPAALRTMALAALMAYTAISAYRLAHAAPAIFTSDSIVYYMVQKSLHPGYYGFSAGVWAAGHPALVLITKIGYVVTTCFEVLAPLCLVSRRFRYLWLAVIVPFHFSTLFLMNIFFWEVLLLFAVVLIDIAPLLRRARRLLGRMRPVRRRA